MHGPVQELEVRVWGVKVLGALILVSMSSACVPKDYAAENFRLERKVCMDSVGLGLYDESYVDPLFRPGPAALRQAAMDWAREEYLSCMHHKGWRLAQGAYIAASGEIYYP